VRIDHSLGAWSGRVDAAEGDLALRWHQVVHLPRTGSARGGVSLIGLASDAGVRRNLGRPGAAQGPAAIRRQLSNLPVRQCRDIVDAGTVVVEDDELEAAQEAYAGLVSAELDEGRLPIGLGGGHEIAFGSFLGLAAVVGRTSPRPSIGVLNIDTHFDLRTADRGTSGTPFRQIAEWCSTAGWPFRYAVFGISPFANTEALFQRARDWHVRWRQDDHMEMGDLTATVADVTSFIAGVDHLYLTICLDVLPASVAPGVSAPSAGGVALPTIERIVDVACASGKMRLADVAELCPAHDDDNRTSRVAARLVGRVAEGWVAAIRGRQDRKESPS
jgi:formiminoglutamase